MYHFLIRKELKIILILINILVFGLMIYVKVNFKTAKRISYQKILKEKYPIISKSAFTKEYLGLKELMDHYEISFNENKEILRNPSHQVIHEDDLKYLKTVLKEYVGKYNSEIIYFVLDNGLYLKQEGEHYYVQEIKKILNALEKNKINELARI